MALSGMIDDPGLADVIGAESDLDRASEALINRANENGGVDNITCILARLGAPRGLSRLFSLASNVAR